LRQREGEGGEIEIDREGKRWKEKERELVGRIWKGREDA
jgi:hypothetical protein